MIEKFGTFLETYKPEKRPAFAQPNTAFYRDENGKDWYEFMLEHMNPDENGLFVTKGSDLWVCLNKDGVVCAANHDISMLAPFGFTIARTDQHAVMGMIFVGDKFEIPAPPPAVPPNIDGSPKLD